MQRRTIIGISAILVFSLSAASAATATPLPLPLPSSPETSPDQERAAECLTIAIAYEAGFEPVEGQEAVAEVILNRVRHPAFPKSVCGVVFQGSGRRTGCQFTFTCDGALSRRLPPAVLTSARQVALAALAGDQPVRASGATHYHANYVMPYWAPSLVNVTNIGAHIFYRMRGQHPGSQAGGPYLAKAEPDVASRFTLASARGKFGGATLLSGPLPPPPPAVKPVFAPWGLPTAMR